uniref:Uncharacterized protein n=1 Tax=Parascaris univalens TaxID=6257 RepID=A0A914ZNB0_PARUN
MELKVAVPSSSANEELNDASMSSEDEEIVDPLSSAREELSHCRQQFLVAVSYPRMDPLEYVMFGKVYRIGGEESSAESKRWPPMRRSVGFLCTYKAMRTSAWL